MKSATLCKYELLIVILSLLTTHCTADFDDLESADGGYYSDHIGIHPADIPDQDNSTTTAISKAFIPFIDECPDDPSKTESGICGCGRADDDSDGDGTADCNDDCPGDPNKIVAGKCGCDRAEGTCLTVNILSDRGLEGADGMRQYFWVLIPVGARNIMMSVFGGTGDADLYVKSGVDVSSSTYDCRPWILGEGITETCSFDQPGLYTIMVRANGRISDWSLSVSYL